MTVKPFLHTARKALWNWLSKNTTKDKDEWPGWKSNGGKVPDNQFVCLACQYSYELTAANTPKGSCMECPITRNNSSVFCFSTCLNGLFLEWEIAPYLPDRRKRVAERIRDLPVREGVECV